MICGTGLSRFVAGRLGPGLLPEKWILSKTMTLACPALLLGPWGRARGIALGPNIIMAPLETRGLENRAVP